MIKNIYNRIKKSKNNQELITNLAASVLIKGLAIIINLLTIPSYLKYFNNQAALGIWFTLLSIMTWVLAFDIGIGNGLRNHLIMAFANNDKERIKRG